MRTYLPLLQLLTTTTLALIGLGLFFWYIPSALPLRQELGSLPGLLRTLRQEAEAEERLEQEKGRIEKKQRQTQVVLDDFLARRCTLREAAARFQALCDRRDCAILRATYHDHTSSLEELFTRHVLELTQDELKRQPVLAGPLQAQLEAESARLRSSSEDPPSGPEPWLN